MVGPKTETIKVWEAAPEQTSAAKALGDAFVEKPKKNYNKKYVRSKSGSLGSVEKRQRLMVEITDDDDWGKFTPSQRLNSDQVPFNLEQQSRRS